MSALSMQEILALLPHRYPFLLVDKVVDFEVHKRIQAIKNVTMNEPFFQGHFPGMPVMPGVLQLEALAQAMGVLAFKTLESEGVQRHADQIFYFAGIDGARFKRPVVPGDQLLLEIEILRHKRDIWKAAGKVTVDGDLACSAELMAAYKG